MSEKTGRGWVWELEDRQALGQIKRSTKSDLTKAKTQAERFGLGMQTTFAPEAACKATAYAQECEPVLELDSRKNGRRYQDMCLDEVKQWVEERILPARDAFWSFMLRQDVQETIQRVNSRLQLSQRASKKALDAGREVLSGSDTPNEARSAAERWLRVVAELELAVIEKLWPDVDSCTISRLALVRLVRYLAGTGSSTFSSRVAAAPDLLTLAVDVLEASCRPLHPDDGMVGRGIIDVMAILDALDSAGRAWAMTLPALRKMHANVGPSLVTNTWQSLTLDGVDWTEDSIPADEFLVLDRSFKDDAFPEMPLGDGAVPTPEEGVGRATSANQRQKAFRQEALRRLGFAGEPPQVNFTVLADGNRESSAYWVSAVTVVWRAFDLNLLGLRKDPEKNQVRINKGAWLSDRYASSLDDGLLEQVVTEIGVQQYKVLQDSLGLDAFRSLLDEYPNAAATMGPELRASAEFLGVLLGCSVYIWNGIVKKNPDILEPMGITDILTQPRRNAILSFLLFTQTVGVRLSDAYGDRRGGLLSPQELADVVWTPHETDKNSR